MSRRRSRPAVELLEDRQVPSLLVDPSTISLKTAGHGTFDVYLLSDDTSARAFLQGSGIATTTITAAGGRVVVLAPVSSQRANLNGDNILDLVQTFRRSDLQGLSSGSATVTMTLRTSTSIAVESLALVLTGGHKPLHHTPHKKH
jgi:hypothetical protein